MNTEDRIWYLQAKKLANEASATELHELRGLLKSNPDIGNQAKLLNNWWHDSRQQQTDSSQLFDKIKQQIKVNEANVTYLPNNNTYLSGRIKGNSTVGKNIAMLKNYLKIALRQLSKQKMYATIKVGGFAFSVAACILIALYIKSETGYDKAYPDADRIYRVIGQYDIDGVIKKGPSLPPAFRQGVNKQLS